MPVQTIQVLSALPALVLIHKSEPMKEGAEVDVAVADNNAAEQSVAHPFPGSSTSLRPNNSLEVWKKAPLNLRKQIAREQCMHNAIDGCALTRSRVLRTYNPIGMRRNGV